jgi:flagellar assembly protein FliH
MSSSNWEPLKGFWRKDSGFEDWCYSRRSEPVFEELELHGLNSTRKAEREAQRILEEAKSKAAQLEREAFEKGFALGEKAGREMAEKAMEETLMALNVAISGWREEMERRWEELTEEVVRLALAVARKVIKREVVQDPKVILDSLRGALKGAALREEVIIKVHPMDAETLRESKGSLLRELEEVNSLRIEADERLSRGDALVECPQGELDLRLERQLREIEKTFEKLITEEKESRLPR